MNFKYKIAMTLTLYERNGAELTHRSFDIDISPILTPLVKFTFALWNSLMGTPTAAGFHSPLSGAFSQGLIESREKQQCDGNTCSRHPLIYWSPLTLARLTWWASRAYHHPRSISIFTLPFLEVPYILWFNCLNLINRFIMFWKTLHCLLLEQDRTF